MTWLLVALGAAVGAPLRVVVAHLVDGEWPWGTLLVNVAGSAVLGWCTGRALDGHALALLGTGFCGGLTTYSAFAVGTHRLGWGRGAAYAVLTSVLGLVAAAAGFWLGAA